MAEICEELESGSRKKKLGVARRIKKRLHLSQNSFQLKVKNTSFFFFFLTTGPITTLFKKKRNKEYVLEGGSVWEGISTGPTASEGMDCTGLGDASAETTM